MRDDMTEDQVRDLIRQEMRGLRNTLWNVETGNHDAQEAIRAIRNAIDSRFPESPREAAGRIKDYEIRRASRYASYDLDDIGNALGFRRAPQQSDDDYTEQLLKWRERLLGETP